MDKYTKGILSELIAAILLWLKGYTLLEKRYKTKVGEIDLIVRNRKRILFVEVKARNDLMSGLEAVTKKSQQRITKAARFYLQRHPNLEALEQRFDVIVVCPWKWPRHLRNAWNAL